MRMNTFAYNYSEEAGGIDKTRNKQKKSVK